MKKYVITAIAGFMIFGCGANIALDLGSENSLVTLEKNINKG